MSKHKFTTGPWKTCHNGKCRCKQIWSETADHPVATIEAGEWGDTYPAISKEGKAVIESIPYGEISEETAEANANLIAAAPELLEALERCEVLVRLRIENDIDDETTAGHMARAAIAKAKGEVK
jgi:hypothetical protein